MAPQVNQETHDAHASTDDLSGRLDVFPLTSVLQFLGLARFSGELQISSPTRAELVVDDGMVRRASHGHLDGMEAALSLLGLKSGRFSFVQRPSRGRDSGELFDINTMLMERVRIEDELERHLAFVPERHQRLVRAQPDSPPSVVDALGCGVNILLDAIHQPSSLAQLEKTVPLCEIKVALATAILIEHSVLRVSSGVSSAAIKAVRPPEPSSQRTFLEDKRGLVRALCATDARAPARHVELAVRKLAQAIHADLPKFTVADKGPTFVRLRPEGGGIISLTLLPLARVNRVLFQSFVPSADVVLLPADRLDDEAASWRAAILSKTRLGFYHPDDHPSESLSDEFLRRVTPSQ